MVQLGAGDVTATMHDDVLGSGDVIASIVVEKLAGGHINATNDDSVIVISSLERRGFAALIEIKVVRQFLENTNCNMSWEFLRKIIPRTTSELLHTLSAAKLRGQRRRFYETLIASSLFNPYPGHIVALFDMTLREDLSLFGVFEAVKIEKVDNNAKKFKRILDHWKLLTRCGSGNAK